MTQDNHNTARNSVIKNNQTRRRFLQLTGLGSVGIAGCTRFGPGRTNTPTDLLSTLFATWRGRDPTSTITLQWLTSTEERSDPVSVEVSQENDEGNVTTQTDVVSFGESHLSRHRAILTDLESDTRYRVSIDESDTGLFVRTAPDEVTNSLTFAEGGDIGTSSDVPQLHEQATGWDPLFAFVGGDLAYADGRDSDRWITFLEHWNEYMRFGDRLIPLVAAIGNHEVRGGMNESPEEAPFFYTLFDNPFRDHAYWALDVGGTCRY